MKRQAVVLTLCLTFTAALNNGVGQTPAMGYNTWNDFRCSGITAGHVQEVADQLDALGLRELGYSYVNIDDCWAIHRDARTHKLLPDPKAFPNGMQNLSASLHDKGFRLGIYTDRGPFTCQRRPGSMAHEVIDAQTFADWGVDYVKEDSCYTLPLHAVAFAEYGSMRDALNKTGRPIYFSLCGWHAWYAPKGRSLGNSWRIAMDCNGWNTIYNAIRTNEGLAKYAGPGGWNDPDMLIGSNPAAAVHVTETQSRTQFSMWSIMAAPLLIGSNVLNMSAFDLETYSNMEVISIDQDRLGKQGEPVYSNCPHHKFLADAKAPQKAPTVVPHCQQVWSRPLSSGQVALIFINYATNPVNITCDTTCLSAAGLSTDLLIRDVWKHEDIGTFSEEVTLGVEPAGGSRTVLATNQ